MQFSPVVRNGSLTLHILTSVGWAGAVGVFLAHSIATIASADARVVRAAAWAMDVAAWYAILPLALASLASGILHAIGTPWGLARHYWVTFKLALALAATAVLLLKLGPISALAEVASVDDAIASQGGLKISLMLHAVGGLVILVAATVLAVFKPRGRISWGVSSEQRETVPAWVKASLVVFASLLILLIVMLVAGGHGPSRHG